MKIFRNSGTKPVVNNYQDYYLNEKEQLTYFIKFIGKNYIVSCDVQKDLQIINNQLKRYNIKEISEDRSINLYGLIEMFADKEKTKLYDLKSILVNFNVISNEKIAKIDNPIFETMAICELFSIIMIKSEKLLGMNKSDEFSSFKEKISSNSGVSEKSEENSESSNDETYVQPKDESNEIEKKAYNDVSERTACAYINGSFYQPKKFYSYGIIMKYDNKIIKLSGKDNNPDFVPSRQISGQLLAAIIAIKEAINLNQNVVIINHNIEGIEAYAGTTEDWTLKSKITQYFKREYDKYKTKIKIVFKKIDSKRLGPSLSLAKNALNFK